MEGKHFVSVCLSSLLCHTQLPACDPELPSRKPGARGRGHFCLVLQLARLADARNGTDVAENQNVDTLVVDELLLPFFILYPNKNRISLFQSPWARYPRVQKWALMVLD